MTSQPETTPEEPRKLSVRRAPKYVPFLIAGALAGVAAAAFVTFLLPTNDEFDSSSVFGLLAVLLMLPGVGLGALVALILDRQGRRRAETLVVQPLPDEDSQPPADKS